MVVALDTVVRMGRTLKDKAPKSDESILHDSVVHVKAKWTSLCTKALDRYTTHFNHIIISVKAK